MKIGIVSDPHGCLVGLAAVLEWLEKAGVDLIACGGDVASFGPQPNECIALLAERGIPTVQGNTDRDLVQPPPVTPPKSVRAAELATIEDWSRGELTPGSRAWLAALPGALEPAPGLRIVHGGLEDADEIVTKDSQPQLPPGISAVTAGHMHTPFIIHIPQGIWVNAGSAGRPTDGDPRAALAFLEKHPQGWEASIHRIPFDLEAAAEAIRSANMPFSAKMIQTQRRACWW